MSKDNKTKISTDFDLESLRIRQDFAETLGVQKVLTRVPVRKPNKSEFVRVRPGNGYRIEVGIVELKDERETYLIRPEVMQEPGVCDLVVPARMVTCVNRQNIAFLWPLKLGRDGRVISWYESALQAAQMAEIDWIRISADMSLGAYQIYKAVAELPDPEWPDCAFEELLRIGFKGMIVDTPDHPLIGRLTGAI